MICTQCNNPPSTDDNGYRALIRTDGGLACLPCAERLGLPPPAGPRVPRTLEEKPAQPEQTAEHRLRLAVFNALSNNPTKAMRLMAVAEIVGSDDLSAIRGYLDALVKEGRATSSGPRASRAYQINNRLPDQLPPIA